MWWWWKWTIFNNWHIFRNHSSYFNFVSDLICSSDICRFSLFQSEPTRKCVSTKSQRKRRSTCLARWVFPQPDAYASACLGVCTCMNLCVFLSRLNKASYSRGNFEENRLCFRYGSGCVPFSRDRIQQCTVPFPRFGRWPLITGALKTIIANVASVPTKQVSPDQSAPTWRGLNDDFCCKYQ